MPSFATLLFLLNFYIGFSIGIEPEQRIIGGVQADISEMPYQLSLNRLVPGKKIEHKCGASVITPYWALSAAHCTYRIPTKEVVLRSDSNYWDREGKLHQAYQIVAHPLYDSRSNENDIALIQVYDKFRQNQTIFLAKQSHHEGRLAIIGGWGLLAHDLEERPYHLQSVEVMVIKRELCSNMYQQQSLFPVTPTMLCATSLVRRQKGFCTGDDGGPLVIADTQIGIASRHGVCGHTPGVYTDVAPFYEWIQCVMGKLP